MFGYVIIISGLDGCRWGLTSAVQWVEPEVTMVCAMRNGRMQHAHIAVPGFHVVELVGAPLPSIRVWVWVIRGLG